MRSLFYNTDSEWQLKHNRMEKTIKIHHCGKPKTSAGVGGGSFNETSERKSFSLFSDVTVISSAAEGFFNLEFFLLKLLFC